SSTLIGHLSAQRYHNAAGGHPNQQSSRRFESTNQQVTSDHRQPSQEVGHADNRGKNQMGSRRQSVNDLQPRVHPADSFYFKDADHSGNYLRKRAPQDDQVFSLG